MNTPSLPNAPRTDEQSTLVQGNDFAALLAPLAHVDWALNAVGEAVPVGPIADLNALRDAVRQRMHTLDRSALATALAGHFMRRPWLDGFTVTANQMVALSDEGELFRAMSCQVESLALTTDAALLAEAFGGESPDTDQLCDELGSELDEHISDMGLWRCLPAFEAFADAELTLPVSRALLANLLAGTHVEPVSGTELAAALLPVATSATVEPSP